MIDSYQILQILLDNPKEKSYTKQKSERTVTVMTLFVMNNRFYFSCRTVSLVK